MMPASTCPPVTSRNHAAFACCPPNLQSGLPTMAMARRPPLDNTSAYTCCLLSPANLDADALVRLQAPQCFCLATKTGIRNQLLVHGASCACRSNATNCPMPVFSRIEPCPCHASSSLVGLLQNSSGILGPFSTYCAA